MIRWRDVPLGAPLRGCDPDAGVLATEAYVGGRWRAIQW